MKNKISFYKKKLLFALPWSWWGWVHKLAAGRFFRKFKFRVTAVGKGSYIDSSVHIRGIDHVSIGTNTTLSENVWLNVNHRNGISKKIVIGNNCHIGKGNFFSSGPLIHVKDFGFTGLDCHFLGCAHRTESPMTPYISSGLTAGDEIVIGVNCWLATSVTIFQGVHIGWGSVIGARSVVFKDVPPFSVAVGNPCKVIKRFNFKENKWTDICDWLEEYEKYIPNEPQYLEKLNFTHSGQDLALLSSSHKFGYL